MFDGGKRFTPPVLRFLESEREAADFVQSGQAYHCIQNPAYDSCFPKNNGNKVESEKADQAPVT